MCPPIDHSKRRTGVTRLSFLAGSALFVSSALDASAHAARSDHAPVPNGSLLGPYNNAWLFTVRQADGHTRQQGIWSDHLQFREADGRRALLRVQGMTYVNGASSSVLNMFDPQTMLPISSQTRGPDGKTIKRTFENGRVKSTNIAGPGAAEVNTDFAAEGPVYDFYGGMYGLLLATFPLGPGAEGVFRSVEEFDDAVTTASFRVVGRERTLAGSRGLIDTWRVEANRTGKPNMTFWLSQAAPYIIKLEMGNAGDAQIMSFDMI